MINWPAIIKYSNDTELYYVSSQSEWDSDTDLHQLKYCDDDQLIDSYGHIYRLTKTTNRRTIPEPVKKTIQLEDFLELVKAHASENGLCCVSKLFAASIKEAMKIIETLN